MHLKVSKSISLLREIGKEFQNVGRRLKRPYTTKRFKSNKPKDLSLKDCSARRCFDSERSELGCMEQ
jgi:hypothetical protein